jgi:hypothetical protein
MVSIDVLSLRPAVKLCLRACEELQADRVVARVAHRQVLATMQAGAPAGAPQDDAAGMSGAEKRHWHRLQDRSNERRDGFRHPCAEACRHLGWSAS